MTYPIYFPEGFDLQQATICGQLVVTAYDMYTQWKEEQDKPKPRDFHWEPRGLAVHYGEPIWGEDDFFFFFKAVEPFAFVAQDDKGTTYLVFRGTSSTDDFVKDAQARQKEYDLVPNYGLTHAGFVTLYKSMADYVAEALTRVERPITSIYVTGHSLGCGLSTCAVPHLIHLPFIQELGVPVFHYNLASPRVGDRAFAQAYNGNGVPTYRVVNTCDLVPEVPSAIFGRELYEHVGIPVNFTAQYGSLVGNHSAHDSYLYALQHANAPFKG
ncbi:MAG TPA: lipase family protein [Anaerolineae bacterium]|nr:lipase family protein [Anaerolineae bacterium]